MRAFAYHSHVEHDEACALREAETGGFGTGASIHRHVDSCEIHHVGDHRRGARPGHPKRLRRHSVRHQRQDLTLAHDHPAVRRILDLDHRRLKTTMKRHLNSVVWPGSVRHRAEDDGGHGHRPDPVAASHGTTIVSSRSCPSRRMATVSRSPGLSSASASWTRCVSPHGIPWTFRITSPPSNSVRSPIVALMKPARRPSFSAGEFSTTRWTSRPGSGRLRLFARSPARRTPLNPHQGARRSITSLRATFAVTTKPKPSNPP